MHFDFDNGAISHRFTHDIIVFNLELMLSVVLPDVKIVVSSAMERL